MVVCLAVGIAVGSSLALGDLLQWFMLTAAVIVTMLVGRWPVVQSCALGLCFILLGMLVAKPPAQTAKGVWIEAVVASAPIEKPKTMMVYLLLPTTGERHRCYLWKEERSRQLCIGDNVMVRLNAEGTDTLTQNEQWITFVRSSDWHAGGDGWNHLTHLQRLRLRALQWREQLVQRLQAGGNDDAQAVLAAMALGRKDALSPALRRTYATTGASHILALSGLHLGIIYMLLSFLMIGRRRYWLSQVIIVLAVWAFALLTGFSTSIVRASVMISLYALFALGGRRRAPLGVLSFTAMVMLLADSRSLFDVGFQLSFMAMLGILLFMPLFMGFTSARWMMAHRVVRWLYGLLAVSLAAQIGTAPLVAYHFGYFSPWFLITNMVVVPAATVILCGALLTLAVPALAGLLLTLTGWLNGALQAISTLPFASIGVLQPTVLQVFLFYLSAAVVYVLLRRWLMV